MHNKISFNQNRSINQNKKTDTNKPFILHNKTLYNQNNNIRNPNDNVPKNNDIKSITINWTPKAIRENNYDLISGDFDQGYPLTKTYPICPQKISTVFSYNNTQWSSSLADDIFSYPIQNSFDKITEKVTNYTICDTNDDCNFIDFSGEYVLDWTTSGPKLISSNNPSIYIADFSFSISGNFFNIFLYPKNNKSYLHIRYRIPVRYRYSYRDWIFWESLIIKGEMSETEFVKIVNCCESNIEISNNTISRLANDMTLIGELSTSCSCNNEFNLLKSNVIYSLENNDLFLFNDQVIIENNKLYLKKAFSWADPVTNFNIYIKASINNGYNAYNIYKMINIVVTEPETTADEFLSVDDLQIAQTGNNVTVQASNGISVTFDHVLSTGYVSIFNSNTGNTTIPKIFDISTTASYSGNISICSSIPNTNNINNMHLTHFVSGESISVDTDRMLFDVNISLRNELLRNICGNVTGLSPFLMENPTNVPSIGTIESQSDNILTTITSGGNSVQAIYNPDGSFSHFESYPVSNCIGNQTPAVINIGNPLNFVDPECGCWINALSVGAALDLLSLLLGALGAAKAAAPRVSQFMQLLNDKRRQLFAKLAEYNMQQVAYDLAKMTVDSLTKSWQEAKEYLDELTEFFAEQFRDFVDTLSRYFPGKKIEMDINGEILIDGTRLEKFPISHSNPNSDLELQELYDDISNSLGKLRSAIDRESRLNNQLIEATVDANNEASLLSQLFNEVYDLRSQLIDMATNVAVAVAALGAALKFVEEVYAMLYNAPFLAVQKTCEAPLVLNNVTCECEQDYSDYSQTE